MRLPARSPHFLILSLLRAWIASADLDRVRPERLHRLALHALLEALEAVGVGGELVEGDVRPVVAVELAGGVALDGGDGAGGRQHRDAIIRHLLVQEAGQGDHRLVAGGADRGRAPADVLLRPGRRAGEAERSGDGKDRECTLDHGILPLDVRSSAGERTIRPGPRAKLLIAIRAARPPGPATSRTSPPPERLQKRSTNRAVLARPKWLPPRRVPATRIVLTSSATTAPATRTRGRRRAPGPP